MAYNKISNEMTANFIKIIFSKPSLLIISLAKVLAYWKLSFSKATHVSAESAIFAAAK